MIKKILSLVLCTMLLITSSGCLGGGDSKETRSDTTPATKDSASKNTSWVDPQTALKTMFQQYIDAWRNNDFKTMYSFLGAAAKEKVSEEAFVNKYNNIYKAIKAGNLVSLGNEASFFVISSSS